MLDIQRPDEEPTSPRSFARLPAFELERYRQYLPKDVDDQAAEELLQNLWFAMCTFVELGWGVESVQNPAAQAQKNRTED